MTVHDATLAHDADTGLLTSFRIEPFGASRGRTAGVTAVLLLTDAAPLTHSLPPLLRAVSRLTVVDQHPHSEARATAIDIAERLGVGKRLRVLDYPFDISGTGRAHLDTPPGATESRVHFHNWAFSHVRTTYAVRWDPALVLTPAGEALLADFDWQVGHHQVTLRLPRHPLYVESDRVAYLDLAWANIDQCGHPVAPGYSYVKGFDREMLRLPRHVRHHGLPLGSCLLVRDVDRTDPSPTAAEPLVPTSPEARRESYEADTVRAIRAGRWHERRELHRLEAPSGIHVVDHAAAYWTSR